MNPIPESIRPRLVAKYDTGKSLKEYEHQTIEVTKEEFEALDFDSSMISCSETKVVAVLIRKEQSFGRPGEPARLTATFAFHDVIE